MTIIDRHLTFTRPLAAFGKEPEFLVLHHEAGSGTVEQIHNFHINSRGWSGIAYHLYVRRDGTVYKGRPLNKQGGHCSGYNDRSVGICVEGNFENELMGSVQKDALFEAIEYVLGVYPELKIVGHRELNATACPGKHFPLEEAKTIMPRIQTISDVPESLRAETQQLIDSGALKGSGAGLDITLDMLRCLIIAKRYTDKKK